MSDEPGIFETIYSLRAMRRLKPDPVPEPLLWKVLEAGTKAPSGGNSQPWEFVVVRDPALKRFIQKRYKRVWDLYLRAAIEAAGRQSPPPSPGEMEKLARQAGAATHLAEHLHEAPVLLLVCLRPQEEMVPADEAGRSAGPAARYASIFPAVQNILLACRALGLGATLTTLHLLYEDEIKEQLGIPSEVETVALIPIGYPRGRFGPTTRVPVQDVAHWDHWGNQRARAGS
jgi:nitroreductase